MPTLADVDTRVGKWEEVSPYEDFFLINEMKEGLQYENEVDDELYKEGAGGGNSNVN